MKLIKVLLAKRTLLIIGVLYTLFISVAFLKSTSDLPKFNFKINDKLIHAIIFTILSSIWLFYAYQQNRKRSVFKNIVWILSLCFLYGIIIEILQGHFIATRKADVLDVLANILGTFFGAFLFWNVKSRIKT